MALLSPTVIRITAIVLVAGTAAFVVMGVIQKPDDQSTANVILAGVVIGGPISAVVGVAAGFIYERLFGPLKSVQHLDMRKDRRPPPGTPDDPDTPPTTRRHTGKGGGKRRR